METIILIVCSGMEEEEEADSQTMGEDLQEPVCELKPADVLIMGEVTKLLAHNKLIKPVSGRLERGQWREKLTCLEVLRVET